MKRVLPTHYFHVVFTLPAELHSVARQNRALVFDVLLRSAAAALLELGRDPKWLGRAAELRAALPRGQRQPCLCGDSHLRAVTGLQQTHTRPAGRASAPRFVQPRVA